MLAPAACLVTLTANAALAKTLAPFKWGKGEEWKQRIFTEEQPFLECEAYDKWMNAKEKYRKLKTAGKI